MIYNGMIFQQINKAIKSYRYRSVPWLILNWKKSVIKHVSQIDQNHLDEKEEKYLSKIQEYFEILNNSKKESVHHLTKQCFGFSIAKCKSIIEGGGQGVVISSGTVSKFSIVAFYPGTVYYPMEPIFFQSIRNSFILRCIDGVLIDGNDKGISKRIFRSCALRDQYGPYMSCDMTWLTGASKNPLSIGQYVNNKTPNHPANVVYQELDIPLSFPIHLAQYLPNINFSALQTVAEDTDMTKTYMVRTIILVALREIMEGEELFSSYFTQIEVLE